ncbi:hypothetical protein QUF49_08860 [Fictibacillus sp. b24]|uniref:hypothetical protein n=1 Tax=Fictibacillus sp. b24 TaxID=3055863 RepID=UPI0025A21A04|nr:hypothetical protein [Fictibacillus sp. b24]MDM5316100.1 hypothetical protein [Fictibacillus sp. b24]
MRFESNNLLEKSLACYRLFSAQMAESEHHVTKNSSLPKLIKHAKTLLAFMFS